MEGELPDWELVHGSDTESTDSITSEKKSGSSSVINDGMILSDHFSADNLINLPDHSLESSDSSRVDYGSEFQNPVDLGFYQSVDAFVRNELGSHDSKIGTSVDGEVRVSEFEAVDDKKLLLVESEAVSESTEGIVSHYEDDEHLLESDHLEYGNGRRHVEKVVESEAVSESTDGTVTHCENGHLLESDDLEVGDGRRQVESQSVVEESIVDLSKSWSDSGGSELVSGDSGILNGEDDVVGGSVVSTEANEESGGDNLDVVAVRSGDESKSRETVWWKMPFVLVKYYAFRVGPVWSISMAAALMGFVLLGRRLYNMKKKAQRFHLKVAIDDKKVSRVMSQAARLNEAFTEVRRVPVIRPALPSPGAWPVLSLR